MKLQLTALVCLATICWPSVFSKADEGGESSPTTSLNSDVDGNDQDEADDRETQAMLGLRVEPLHPAFTSQLEAVIGKGRGIMVTGVAADSPAARAGIRKHDILVMFDKQKLFSPRQLAKLVRFDEPGRSVKIEFVRGAIVNSATVVLGARDVVENPTFVWPKVPSIDPYMIIPDRLQTPVDSNLRSLLITKTDEGGFEARLVFEDGSKAAVSNTYSGTLTEIEAAIRADQSVPTAVQQEALLILGPNTRVSRSTDNELPARFQHEILDRDWPRERVL